MISFEESVSDIYEREITDSDFGFIVDSNGELKTVFFPEGYSGNLPNKVRDLLQHMGVEHPDTLAISTLH